MHTELEKLMWERERESGSEANANLDLGLEIPGTVGLQIRTDIEIY
jgi:hypothetical protein